MFCKKCGKQIDDDAKFCSGCGVKQHHEGKDIFSFPTNHVSLYLILYVIWFIINILFLNFSNYSRDENAINILFPFGKHDYDYGWGEYSFDKSYYGLRDYLDISFYDITDFIIYVLLVPLVIILIVNIKKRYHIIAKHKIIFYMYIFWFVLNIIFFVQRGYYKEGIFPFNKYITTYSLYDFIVYVILLPLIIISGIYMFNKKSK